MLVEVSAEGHVEDLHSAADAQVRHAALDRSAGQRDLEVIALTVGRLDARLGLLAVAARVEVGAADQEQAVDAVEQRLGDPHRSGPGRARPLAHGPRVDGQKHGSGAGRLDRLHVGVRDEMRGLVPEGPARPLADGADADDGLAVHPDDLDTGCAALQRSCGQAIWLEGTRVGDRGVDSAGSRARHRGGDGRAPEGRPGRGRRRSGARQGGLPGLARRRPGGPRAPAAARRRRRSRARRRARAARVAQRRQADLGRAWRDRDGRRRLRVLRGRPRAAARLEHPGGRWRGRDLPRAARRRGADHALELPARDRLLEARPGARRRQHGRAEAGGADAAHGRRARAHRARRGPARRAS